MSEKQPCVVKTYDLLSIDADYQFYARLVSPIVNLVVVFL